LGAAIGFTGAVNLLLLATILWTEWIDARGLTAAWMAAAVIWSGSGLVSLRWCARVRAFDEVGPPQDLFPRALGEYLRGNWYEVEALCHAMLRAEARDIDARLLLASTMRRSGRRDEARLWLAELGRFEASAKWGLEIEHEWSLLAEQADAAGKVAAAGGDSAEGDAQPPMGNDEQAVTQDGAKWLGAA
jgi:hypothetical protein